MQIATFIYKKYIKSTGARKKIWQLVRTATIKLLNDPICTLLIHDINLHIPLSHALPDYLNKFPSYDRLPRRLSDYLHQKQGYLICIDVGANIGDTLAAFYISESDVFLAIEPNPKFRDLLLKNWSWNKNVTIVPDICSNHSNTGAFEIQEKDGTASVKKIEDGLIMHTRQLDEIYAEHFFKQKVNLLKIDTDGHDLEVIKGSTKLLTKYQPTLLFECDAFGNPGYLERCIETMRSLKSCGYTHFLIYDNLGYLMGKHSLSNLEEFRSLLFYQITSKFYYFDILLMQNKYLDDFHRGEINYFQKSI